MDHLFSTQELTKVPWSSEKLQELAGYSDHVPLVYVFNGAMSTSSVQVPNRRFHREVLQLLLGTKQPLDPSSLQRAIKQIHSASKTPAERTVSQRFNFQAQLSPATLNKLVSEDFVAEYMKFVDRIERTRFSQHSSQAFRDLQRSTKYHSFERRDGGILSKAYFQGRIVQGTELARAVLSDFAAIHNEVPLDPSHRVDFP